LAVRINDVATKKAASVVNGSTKVKVKRLGQIRWIVIDKKKEKQ
jgi:hypothetical protein